MTTSRDSLMNPPKQSGEKKPCGLTEVYQFRACELGKPEWCEKSYQCDQGHPHQHTCAHTSACPA